MRRLPVEWKWSIIRMISCSRKRSVISYFDTVMIYVLNARDDLPVQELKDRLSTEGRRRLVSIAEQLREEGEMKKSHEVAKQLLRMDTEEGKITEATNLSLDEIEQIKKDMD